MDVRRERLITAYQNRRTARQAHRDEASRYVAAGWVGDPAPVPDPEPITKEAAKRLRELGAAVDAAEREYEDAAAQP